MLKPDEAVAAGSRLLGRELTLVRALTGGQHAVSVLVADGVRRLVVRAFPRSDPAVEREVLVLDRVAGLDHLVPRLVAHGTEAGHPVIVTTALPGAHPAADLPTRTIAEQMARALDRIHGSVAAGLRRASADHPADLEPDESEPDGLVLTHSDFWCGNALWDGPELVGVIDWSGALQAPRGVDVAWCRQDLVLLGSVEAADHFLREYERRSGTRVPNLLAHDLFAAAHADPVVETWEVNYRGIGRPGLTSAVLRQRLDAWTALLRARR